MGRKDASQHIKPILVPLINGGGGVDKHHCPPDNYPAFMANAMSAKSKVDWPVAQSNDKGLKIRTSLVVN